MEASPVERSDALLDPATDPGGAAMGTLGDGSVDTNWFVLLHRRVSERAVRSPRYQWWALVALLAGLLALNITFTVFVVALPTVAAEFHTQVSVLTWVTTGPLLAFGLAAPLFGRVGDLFGHRRLYLWGLVGAMVSAVLTATAIGAGELIAARCLDGVQGAATGTASMAIILEMFVPEDRVKAMGWWSMVGAGGPVIGVTLGAPIIQFLGWRTLFWVQLGLLVAAFVVVSLVLPAHGHRLGIEGADGAQPDRPTGRRAIDWVGTWSLSGFVIGIMLALSLGPTAGWTAPAVLIPAVLGVLSFGLFAYRLRTAEHPLIPPKYFRRRNFMLPMGTRAFGNFAYFGGFFLFPLMMEQVYGWHETKVGLVSVARPLCFAVIAPVAGYAAVRIGERASVMLGSGAIVLSMVLFAALGATPVLLLIVPALCLAGLGMGVCLPSTSSTQANEVEASEYGVMSATQLLATQVGEVAGIQVLITIQEEVAHRTGSSSGVHGGSALLNSFHVAFWVGAVVAVAGFACAAFIRDLPRARRQAREARLAT
jgi:MFS family permease